MVAELSTFSPSAKFESMLKEGGTFSFGPQDMSGSLIKSVTNSSMRLSSHSSIEVTGSYNGTCNKLEGVALLLGWNVDGGDAIREELSRGMDISKSNSKSKDGEMGSVEVVAGMAC